MKVFVGVANGVITVWEEMLNFIVDGINRFLRHVNTAIEGIGDLIGQDWNVGFNLGKVNLPRIPIPELAQGAVIPPNREFLAVLGDQKHGTNIEAPLDTIKQAVAEVLANSGYSGGNQPIVLELYGREVGRTFGKAIRQEANRVGNSFVKTKLVF